MYFQNKKAFTLIELIFSVALASIILFSTLSILKVLHQENQKTLNITLTKIDFETTRLFLEHKIKEDVTLSNLALANRILLYRGDPLMKNVSRFSKSIETNGIMLTICSDNYGRFCSEIYLQK
ncbi:MAG: prepilin-type N-terminal cleavage/methylation domain-containing protein [Epsilonproteobacteria bacterium]|nr:prepilin-type N-terminal cleavage/methylation domain-containing protein [Campylobacterota bacterium]